MAEEARERAVLEVCFGRVKGEVQGECTRLRAKGKHRRKIGKKIFREMELFIHLSNQRTVAV